MEFFASPFWGVLGVIHLIVFIWALLQILGSSMDILHKILWIVVVWALPIIGLIIYLLMGRRA